jgi:hypothetical protein
MAHFFRDSVLCGYINKESAKTKSGLTPAAADSGLVSIRRKIIAYSTTSRFLAERGLPAKAQAFRRGSQVPPLALSQSVGPLSEIDSQA